MLNPAPSPLHFHFFQNTCGPVVSEPKRDIAFHRGNYTFLRENGQRTARTFPANDGGARTVAHPPALRAPENVEYWSGAASSRAYVATRSGDAYRK